MIPTQPESKITDNALELEKINLLSPVDKEDNKKKEWDDDDDESFEDQADDRDDLHEIQLENNILDPDDDDHLPDED